MPISAQVKIVKTVVIPYFIAIYMAEGSDLWRPLTPKDFDFLGEFYMYLRACGELLRHKITEKDEIILLPLILAPPSLAHYLLPSTLMALRMLVPLYGNDDISHSKKL